MRPVDDLHPPYGEAEEGAAVPTCEDVREVVEPRPVGLGHREADGDRAAPAAGAPAAHANSVTRSALDPQRRLRRTLGVLGFAASAWKCAPRDAHIGWDQATREARLHLVVGNARFLILPHVRVKNLASHVLAQAARRLRADWQDAYGYAPVLLETFVETARFSGASCRAANWTWVGQTTGRGKLDRTHEHALPVKDVYLHPSFVHAAK